MLPDPLPAEPFTLFRAWFDEAEAAKNQPNPNAMTLATVDADGRPSARIVLCKGIESEPGCVIFYTNYQSRKGRALEANPAAALIFHWDHPDRQVRIEGVVERTTPAESDAYYNSRRWESRIGAWASDQSQPVESRERLLEQVSEKVMELDLDLAKLADGKGDELEIPRPAHWGGFRVWVDRMELWSGGTGRVHDRAAWTRKREVKDGAVAWGAWDATRLQP
ncbi:MAG: pyridoxamine 5'-phosphate oxidase [Planctomycetota bacterium]